MTRVHDIAEYILQRCGPMTTMKLQKLVYYSQAWSLALRGSAVFEERVQAWAHGPVVWELFQAHRGQFVVSSVQGQAHRVDVHTRAMVDRVVAAYGSWTADQLSERTHQELPWVQARRLPSARRGSPEITWAAMQDYYRSQLPLPELVS
jgi:uncharacterized phage-associated protein